MREKELQEIISRFEKITGQVAKTIAAEAAAEARVKIEGSKIMPANEGEYAKLIASLKKKFGKIMGEKLAVNIIEQKI